MQNRDSRKEKKREYDKERYLKNKDTAAIRRHEVYLKNWDKERMSQSEYRRNNRESIKIQRHEWYLRNKAELVIEHHEYYLKNRIARLLKNKEYAVAHPKSPEKNCLYNAIHKARKLSLPDTLTSEQWIAIQAAYNYRCAYCGCKPKLLTQDHVIPLSKGGGTTADNIVPACGHCNYSKGNRDAPKIPAIRLFI